jgi:GGDEF domain-containing protein
MEDPRINIEIIITRLNAVLDTRNAKIDKTYELSLSVGYANYEHKNPRSIEELLVEADRLMYAEKQKKR